MSVNSASPNSEGEMLKRKVKVSFQGTCLFTPNIFEHMCLQRKCSFINVFGDGILLRRSLGWGMLEHKTEAPFQVAMFFYFHTLKQASLLRPVFLYY